MYDRSIRIDHSESFFLFGPRGTGKTTWLKRYFSNALYIDLLNVETYSELLANPHRIEEMIGDGENREVIIDEVQRIPMLLNEVHRLIEEKHHRFILTGSSARSLRKKGTNMLAGRALLHHLYPLTAEELGKDFNLKHSLRFGHLPKTFSHENPQAYLASYVDTYLREEVLQEGLTRNIGAFARFLETASFSQAQVLNLAAIARDAHMERKVVGGYFNILEDLLLAFRLPAFTKKAKRRIVLHHKFYFFDVGIFRSIRPTGILDSEAETDGPALETLVLQEMMAVNEYKKYNYDFSYWRTSHGTEVDFILYGPKGLLAMEIKRSKNIQPQHLHGLKSFRKDYPAAKCYLLYGGEMERNFDGIRAIPVIEFLRNISKYIG